MSLFIELKRRNVFKVAVAYIVTAWLMMQVADVILNNVTAPGWVFHVILLLLGIGFVFAIFFAWEFELTADGLKREHEVNHSRSITHTTSRKLDFAIIGLLALALAYFIWESRFRDAGPTAPGTAAEAVKPDLAREATAMSIAVLPFTDMSPEGDQEYFSDGISEELLNVLARYPDLRVAARTSSFQFKGQNPDVKDIASKLNVNHVLEGSVRKSGNNLRITAQLIEADSGYHLWSETYDRELTDVFAIQDEISAAIGDALEIQLALEGTGGKESPSVLAAANTGAFEAYVQGRQLINLRGRMNLEQAVKHLEKALALDENYAPAHAQLAIAISLLGNTAGSYGDMPVEEVVSRPTPHIERAFDLQPQMPEAFAAATMLSLIKSDYDGVISNAKRTLELNPSYADAVSWLNLAYEATGQYLESGKTLERLLEIDPLSFPGRFNYAKSLGRKGQMEAAQELADSMPGHSRHVTNAMLSYYAGETADALGWSLKAFEMNPDDFFVGIYMARTLAQLDLFSEALLLQDNVHYWAYLHSQAWPELVAVARKRMEKGTSDPNSKLLLANALHLSGQIEEAQVFYEDLLASAPGLPLINAFRETVMPTARAAFGRMILGDETGAQALVSLASKDQQERNRAGILHADYHRAFAILEVLRGNHDAALRALELAIETGPRDPGIFLEPAFEVLYDLPEFQALKARMSSVLASEREKALQMLCFNNPAAKSWQPLPKTCAGVEPVP